MGLLDTVLCFPKNNTFSLIILNACFYILTSSADTKQQTTEQMEELNMNTTEKCAVRGLTTRGQLLARAMRRTRDLDEIMEQEILKNTDDTIRCYKVKKDGKVVGYKTVNVSKMFPISVSTIKKDDKIQEEIQSQLDEAYASLTNF